MTELRWMVKFPTGERIPWMAAYSTRAKAMERATGGSLSAGEFERLATPSKRWRALYRRGYRVVRVVIADADNVALLHPNVIRETAQVLSNVAEELRATGRASRRIEQLRDFYKGKEKSCQ